jgi:hypothetical protein
MIEQMLLSYYGGDMSKVEEFLNTENVLLRNKKPCDLIRDGLDYKVAVLVLNMVKNHG